MMADVLDACTFGDSKAAINLIGILNGVEDKRIKHRASKILSKYQGSLKPLSRIPDKEIRETAYNLWRSHFIEWVDRANFPIVIETHMKCVIVGEFRKAIRRNDDE